MSAAGVNRGDVRDAPDRATARRDLAVDAVDAGGTAVVALAVAWVQLGAPRGPGTAAVSALLVLVWGAAAAARLLTQVAAWAVPAAVAAAAAGLAIASWPDLLSSPIGPPLGYANANAALWLVSAGAALLAAVRVRNVPVRIVAVVAAAGFAALPLLMGADAAALLVFLLPVGLVAARGPRTARALVVGGLIVSAAVVAATVVLGTGAADSTPVASALSERRLALWADALRLVADAPLRGVGAGHFTQLSPTARADADTPHAHAELLEVAAETGLVGAALVLGVVGWAYLRLYRGAGGAASGVGAALLTAVVVASSIDYVLHFPVVPATTAALIAAAGTRPRHTG